MLRICKSKALLTLALLATTSIPPGSANAATAGYSVPAGCASPSKTYIHQWYVDPVKGSDSGNGSQSKPWKTLQAVFAAGLVGYQSYPLPWTPAKVLNPAPSAAVIHPGDVIWLASGNHGSLGLENAYNANFITIKALPGATPKLTNIVISGGGHWIFDDLTIESIKSPALTSANQTLVYVRSNPNSGPINNIIINGNTVKSQDDTSAWLPSDWNNNAASGIFLHAGLPLADGTTDYNGVNDGQCFSITNNAVSDVAFGITATMADKVLVAHNTVNRFADDAMDYGVSDAIYDGNIITNAIDDGDGIHRDAIQGQPYWGENTYNHDVTFKNNIVIVRTDPNLKYPACIQGIDAFDGKWDRINAYNNLIVVNTDQALAFYGVQGANLINNTVLGVITTCTLQPGAVAGSNGMTAGPLTDTGLAGGTGWIGVQPAKSGLPSTKVVIRNNIASNYLLPPSGITAFDHNILASNNPKFQFHSAMASVQPTIANPDNLFVNFGPAEYNFDVHLKSGSPAIAAGLVTGAPTTDVYGSPRKAPIDDGAIAAATKDAAVLGGTLR